MRTLESLGISPAPWKRTGDWIVANANYDPIDGTTESTRVVETKSDADARLIAAAPSLYEALREIMTCWGDSVFDEGGMMCEIEESSHCGRCDQKGCPIYRKARAALAAAGGESEAAK